MKLFPACAGVILAPLPGELFPASFPRVCGGDPWIKEFTGILTDFSPRVRG